MGIHIIGVSPDRRGSISTETTTTTTERNRATFEPEIFTKSEVETRIQVEPKLKVSKELKLNAFSKGGCYHAGRG